MSVADYQVDIGGGSENQRRTLNAILANLRDGLGGFGSVLPAPTGTDGRLFVVTPANQLYQLQSGSWVAL